ncbi:MAG: Asp23/Gls24 family envelope stress response protein [Bacillota bacterium]
MEVFALTGPSGTGKSHRAWVIAREHGIGAIIDDGVLVIDGKLVAGNSAKREETKIAAIKRALFTDAAQVEAVGAAIAGHSPDKVLILGTSQGMVKHIAMRLGLPAPDPVLSIEEVATPGEIRRALRTRRELGKHVVPAPTLEVRKTFSGYLVDPLRIFLRKDGRVADSTEKSVVRPTFSSLGKFTIADVVVNAIARRAADESAGVAKVLKAQVEVRGAGGIELSVDVSVVYGSYIPTVLRDLQRHVAQVVEHMTSLNVLAVRCSARQVTLRPGEAQAATASRGPSGQDTDGTD